MQLLKNKFNYFFITLIVFITTYIGIGIYLFKNINEYKPVILHSIERHYNIHITANNIHLSVKNWQLSLISQHTNLITSNIFSHKYLRKLHMSIPQMIMHINIVQSIKRMRVVIDDVILQNFAVHKDNILLKNLNISYKPYTNKDYLTILPSTIVFTNKDLLSLPLKLNILTDSNVIVSTTKNSYIVKFILNISNKDFAKIAIRGNGEYNFLTHDFLQPLQINTYFQQGNTKHLAQYLPLKFISFELRKWLLHAIDKNAVIDKGNFDIKLMSLKQKVHTNIDLNINFHNLSLNYDDNWQHLTNATGKISFKDDDVFIYLKSAKVSTVIVKHAVAQILNIKPNKPADLNIWADINGNIHDILQILAKNVSQLDKAQKILNLAGDANAHFNLHKLLIKDTVPEVSGKLFLHNNIVDIYDYKNINFKHVNGKFIFNNNYLRSEDLQGQFFKHNIKANLIYDRFANLPLYIELEGLFSPVDFLLQNSLEAIPSLFKLIPVNLKIYSKNYHTTALFNVLHSDIKGKLLFMPKATDFKLVSRNFLLQMKHHVHNKNSLLIGSFSSTDLMNIIPTINCKETKLSFDLNWHGILHDFDLSKLNGKINLFLEKGHITGIDPGITRLFSIFNFDFLSRHLQFDFSDILGRGLSFATISSSWQLFNGIAFTDDFHLSGSQNKINIDGSIDFIRHKYNLLIDVEPQLANSIPLATTLVSGNPLVSTIVWMLDKVFKNTFDAITERHYKLLGSFAHPNLVNFDKEIAYNR